MSLQAGWPLRPGAALALAAVFALAAAARPAAAAEPEAGTGPAAGAEADQAPLTVALTGKYPPFSFYDENGELAGFDVDVSRAVAGRLGRRLEIVATEWDGILAGLLSGKYDAIIGSMAITPERARQVDFSEPYYVSGAQLFVRRSDRGDLDGIAACAGRPVGVGLGETYEHYLRREHPEVEAVTYKSTVDIFQDMENDRLSGFITDKLVGAWQVKSAGRDFVPAGKLLFEERIGIPVRKDRPELLAGINAALADMQASGERDRLFEKWFGLARRRPTGMSAATVVRLLLRGFGITIGVAVASLAIGFVLAIPLGMVLNRGRGAGCRAVRAFVDFVRGTPVLIQLLFVYFGAPQVGVTLSPIASAVLTLSVSAAAYMSEIVRSGLMSVDHGQELAARALGLSGRQTFRLVVWPQAFRVAMPPLINAVVALTKDTALISVISVGEVVREAQSIISVTFQPIQYYLIVAGMFFVFTFPLMKLAGRVEARMKERGFVHD